MAKVSFPKLHMLIVRTLPIRSEKSNENADRTYLDVWPYYAWFENITTQFHSKYRLSMVYQPVLFWIVHDDTNI